MPDLKKAAGWVASGIGVAALVAALGGAALYVRFATAHIPAAEALTVVPNAELVVRGAMALALYLLLGGAAVVVVWLLDDTGSPGRATVLGLMLVVVAEMLVPVFIAADVPDLVRWLIVGALVVAVLLGAWLYPLLLTDTPQAATVLIACELVAVALVLIWSTTLAATLLLAALLLFAVLRVAEKTGKKFAPYAVAVFLSVVVFGAGAISLRALDVPQARPVALLVSDDARGICGLYVTETDKRVYIAQVELTPRTHDPVRKTGRIIAIPKGKVIAESIGDVQKVSHAYRRAREMRNGLLRSRPPTTAPQDTVVTTRTFHDANGVQRVEQVTSKRPAARAGGGTGNKNDMSALFRAQCATAHVSRYLR